MSKEDKPTIYRIRRYYLGYHQLVQMAIGTALCRKISSNLPSDARVFSVHDDQTRKAFIFIIQSESFDEVPEAGCCPEAELLFDIQVMPEGDEAR